MTIAVEGKYCELVRIRISHVPLSLATHACAHGFQDKDSTVVKIDLPLIQTS
jgi:hypothetical protein